MLGLVDEGLQQPGPVAVPTLEVLAHRARRPAQHVRGQIAALHVGANQAPAQPHHPVQVDAPVRVVPSDPDIASLQPPRRGREPHAAEPPVGGADQITQLRADKGTRTTRVLVSHQCVPDQELLVGLDPHQRKVPQLADLARYVARPRHRLREHSRPTDNATTTSRRGQREVARSLQVGQRLVAARALPMAAAIAKIERFTYPVGDPPHSADALRRRPVEHVAHSGKIGPQRAPDLILNLHAEHGSKGAA